MRARLSAIVFLLAWAVPCLAEIRIDAPVPPYDTFAEFRDFYVRGSFPGGVKHPGNLKVELFRGPVAAGHVVRTLESQVDADGVTPSVDVETHFADGTAWGQVDISKVPDLIKTPGGLEEPGNKVMVTHNWFAAEIFGGVTKTYDLAYRDTSGKALEDLYQGDYTIRVTGTSGDMLGQQATAVVHFAYQAKILGRFTPPAHLKNLEAYAQSHHCRIFEDAFPGFFKPDPAGNPTYEIVNRWRPNNSEEIINFDPRAHYGKPLDAVNHLVMYNLSAGCVTEQVEVAAIVRAKVTADLQRTEYLRYDLGEPELDYEDTLGQKVKVMGKFVSMNAGAIPAVCRIETGMADPGADNEYRSFQVTRKTVLVPAPGKNLELSRSYAWAVFGVVPPIPADVAPVAGLAASYTVNDHVKWIRYELTGNGGTKVFAGKRPVGLVRVFSAGASAAAASIYEFKHVLQPPADLAPGIYHLELSALDAEARPVAGMTTTLTVKVTP